MISIAQFKGIIFDFDGVLVDSGTLQARAWSCVAAELAVPMTVAVAQIAGKLDRRIAPELFPSLDPAYCVSRKQCIELEMEAAGELTAIDETLAFVRRVASTHAMAVCSSSCQERIERLLKHFGAGDLFKIIIGQIAGEECKPSAAPYLRALRLLNISADDACAIEDSATGLTAAKAAGLYAIQLLHDGMSACEIADAVIRSAGEID